MEHKILKPTLWDKKNPMHIIGTDDETLSFFHQENHDSVLITLRSKNKRRELYESFTIDEIKKLCLEIWNYLESK